LIRDRAARHANLPCGYYVLPPVTVANAVNDGEISPLVRSMGSVIYNALSGILKYL